MRALPVLIVLSFLAVGFAVAQNATNTPTPISTSPSAACSTGNSTSNSPALREWRRACFANITEFRRESVESFNENKTLHTIVRDANLSHIQAAFQDAKVQAFKDCRLQAAPYPHFSNASGGQTHESVFAACMRDKLATLRNDATNATAAARDQLTKDLQADRDAAAAEFVAKRDAWLAANPRPA